MNELSKEELAAACAEKVKQLEFAVTQSAFGDVRQELETELEIARVALAARQERAEPVAYADPRAFRNFMTGTATKEWMWARPDAGLVPVFVEAPPAPVLEDVARERAEPVYQLWSSGINQWVECDKVRYDAHAHVPAQRRVLYTAPPASVVPDEQHSERFEWSYEDWANHLGGRHQNNDPAYYYEFGSFIAVAEMLRQFGNVQRKVGWNACRDAMLQGAESASQQTSDEHVRREYRMEGSIWVQCSKQEYDRKKSAGREVRELYERPQNAQQNTPTLREAVTAMLNPAQPAPVVPPVQVPEWTNEQCLEFLSIAFRHAEIKGDLELDDLRLGVKMANAMTTGKEG